MKNGKGRHLTLIHLYTEYKFTGKDFKDLTALQYQAILVITEEIMKYKHDNKPMVVI